MNSPLKLQEVADTDLIKTAEWGNAGYTLHPLKDESNHPFSVTTRIDICIMRIKYG